MTLRATAILAWLSLVAGCGGVTQPASGLPAAWSSLADAPLALTEVAATAHRGAIWVAGGLTVDGRATDRVLILDPGSGAWSEGPPLPAPVHHAALTSDGDALWLLGGYVGDGFAAPTDAVYRLVAEAPRWEPSAPLPAPRAAGAAAWDGERLVYGGGVGPENVSGLVFGSGPEGFQPIARLSLAREHLAAASDGAGRVWFLGGRDGGLQHDRGRVDLVRGDRSSVVGEMPTSRGGVAAFHWPSLGVCLVGGERPGGTHAEVECLADDGRAVTLPDLESPRHGLGTAVVDGTVYVVFGGPIPGLTVSATVEALALR